MTLMWLTAAQEFQLTESGYIVRVEVKPAPKKPSPQADKGANA